MLYSGARNQKNVYNKYLSFDYFSVHLSKIKTFILRSFNLSSYASDEVHQLAKTKGNRTNVYECLFLFRCLHVDSCFLFSLHFHAYLEKIIRTISR